MSTNKRATVNEIHDHQEETNCSIASQLRPSMVEVEKQWSYDHLVMAKRKVDSFRTLYIPRPHTPFLHLF